MVGRNEGLPLPTSQARTHSHTPTRYVWSGPVERDRENGMSPGKIANSRLRSTPREKPNPKQLGSWALTLRVSERKKERTNERKKEGGNTLVVGRTTRPFQGRKTDVVVGHTYHVASVTFIPS